MRTLIPPRKTTACRKRFKSETKITYQPLFIELCAVCKLTKPQTQPPSAPKQTQTKPSTTRAPKTPAAPPVPNASPRLPAKPISHPPLTLSFILKLCPETPKALRRHHSAALRLSRSCTSDAAVPTETAGVSSIPVPDSFPATNLAALRGSPGSHALARYDSGPQLNSLFCHHELFFIKLWIRLLQHNEQNMSWKMKINGVISSKKNIFHLLLQITLLFVDKMVSQH